MSEKIKELLRKVEKIKSEEEYRELWNIKEQISYLLENKEISDSLNWVLPDIINLNKYLPLEEWDWNVIAISFPTVWEWINLKTPIFAGLFLNQVLKWNVTENTKTIVEWGWYNTGLWMKRMTKILWLEWKFFTTWYFPEGLLNNIKSEDLEIIKADKNNDLAIEEQFTLEFLEYTTKNREKNRDKSEVALWHIKYSFLIAEILAEKIYNRNSTVIDSIDNLVSSVWAWWTLALLNKFNDLKE